MKLMLLVISQGKQEGKTLEIKLPQFLVGRDPQCHLRPASPLISKRHCAILQREGKAFVRDFDSTNGTFVNDEPIKGERELQNDDQLKIGPILFTVRIDAAAAAPSRTPIPPTRAAGTTPAPATKPAGSTPAPKTAAKSDEDDIAAMLLGLDVGDAPASAGTDGVPEGSTIMEIPVPPELANATDNKAAGAAKPAKGTTGDTRSAAANILEKMMRRPRT